MSTHVISFADTGAVEFTRNPAMLSLFEGQRVKVRRMSEILFDDSMQLFYIKFLRGPFAGCVFVWSQPEWVQGPEQDIASHWMAFVAEHSPGLKPLMLIAIDPMPRLVCFETYEDAVKVEIAFIDYLREQGFSMR